jgi:hypothetical protein
MVLLLPAIPLVVLELLILTLRECNGEMTRIS